MSQTFSTNQFFDLISFTRDIPNVDIAAQAAQSLAFRTDLLIQSNARAIFKAMRQHKYEKLDAELQTIDHLAEIESAFREVRFAEKVFAEQGSDNEQFVRNVQELMQFRDGINELAQDLTAMTVDWKGNPRNFTPADLQELFLSRPDLRISQTEQMRSRQMAEQMKAHGLLPESMPIDDILKMDEERRKNELGRVADTMHRQSPVVLMVFELARESELENVAEDFWLLDLTVQRTLIESVRGAVQREMDRAKSNRSLSSMDFMALIGSGMAALKKLDEVLRGSRFGVLAARERAVAAD